VSAPRPGILTFQPTQRDARIRVWFRKPSATDYLFGPELQSMEVHLRGAGVGGEETLESILAEVLPPGCRLVRYELVA
jgi:hypothetical protein